VVFAVPACSMIASMPVALMPFLQNRCVAALNRRPRADSSSLAPACGALFFGDGFAEDLLMRCNLIAAVPHHQAAFAERRNYSHAAAHLPRS
jgi:hypothetical protein